MRKRVIWKVALSVVCGAGLLMGSQAAQTPAAPAQTAPVQKQPQVKSQGEGQAVMAIFRAQDADARIKAVDELLTKYADTEFKAIALYLGAASYQQKNDYENTIVFAERALQADPQHYQAMLMLASTIAQRTREFDLDREEKLARAEKYAKGALQLIQTASKPNPNLTDEQWEGAKKDMNAQAYEALALAEVARKNYPSAIAQFKKSIEAGSTQDPATKVRLGDTYFKAGQYDNAIAILDDVVNATDVHPQIKQFAQAARARAIQAKNGGSKPEQPATPPQVEIKK